VLERAVERVVRQALLDQRQQGLLVEVVAGKQKVVQILPKLGK